MNRKILTVTSIICALALSFMLTACSGGGSGGGNAGSGGNDAAASGSEDAQTSQAASNGSADDTTANSTADADDPDTDNVSSDNDDTQAGINAGTPAPALSYDADIGINIDGQWFPIMQDAAGLLQALGDDYELYTAPSCVFEGDDKEFAYDGCYVYTNPDGSRDIWYNIYITDSAFKTSRGISTGNTVDDVITAYGGGYYWEGDTILTYSVSGIEGDISSPCIQFTIQNDIVTAIEIYYPTNTITA